MARFLERVSQLSLEAARIRGLVSQCTELRALRKRADQGYRLRIVCVPAGVVSKAHRSLTAALFIYRRSLPQASLYTRTRLFVAPAMNTNARFLRSNVRIPLTSGPVRAAAGSQNCVCRSPQDALVLTKCCPSCILRMYWRRQAAETTHKLFANRSACPCLTVLISVNRINEFSPDPQRKGDEK